MAVIICYICCILTYLSAVDLINVGFNIKIIQNETTDNLYLFEEDSLKINTTLLVSINDLSFLNKTFYLKCWMEDIKIGKIDGWKDIRVSFRESLNISEKININMTAIRLGLSKLFCGLGMKVNESFVFFLHQEQIKTIVVKRVPTIQETVFRFVVMFFVIFLTFVMGCGLDRKIILNYLKKPISPAIGFFCQFVFMPIISFGIAKLTNIDVAFGFGLLTIGCSPGGGASNVWTILFGGDLNLSMTMTFISSCSALFMMPFWIFILGRFFIDPKLVQIPYVSITLNLLQVVIPVGFGMLFRWKFEKKADVLIKKVKLMGLIFIIFILTFGTYANFYIYKLMGVYPYLLPIGASLPWFGFIFGLIMSLITKRDRSHAIAISIETGFQNIGIAILILKFSMSQPAGDLGAVMPIIVALFTPLPLYMGLIVLTIKKKCFDKKKVIKNTELNFENKEPRDVLLVNEHQEEIHEDNLELSCVSQDPKRYLLIKERKDEIQ